MSIIVGSNFDLQTGLPLDDRTVVADQTARDAIPALQRYEGLTVYVLADEANYQLVGGITNGDWVESGSSALATHEADTSTHGVTEIVGTVEVQTLSEKIYACSRAFDDTTTGSNANLPTPTTGLVYLRNASLASIDDIGLGIESQRLTLVNDTGNDIDIIDGGSIITGTGLDVTMKNQSVLDFVFDNGVWWIVGGTGGANLDSVTNDVTDALTLVDGSVLTIDTTRMIQSFRVQGNAGPVIVNNGFFGTTPPPDGAILIVVGNHDTNTVTVPSEDSADCIAMNGSVELFKHSTLMVMYVAAMDRYVKIGEG